MMRALSDVAKDYIRRLNRRSIQETLDAKARADLATITNLGRNAEAEGRVNFGIPGPFSRPERVLAYYVASELFTGRGSFIELGSYLGASTQAFAAVLKTIAAPRTVPK